MPLAIFGIENTALNLAATLVVLMLVAIWIALIVFTFTDARRRIADPFLVGCATAASFFPFVGTLVYTILRPPEFLEDIRERETDIQESEVRLRHLKHNSCRKCGSPVESDFIRCPACRSRLKEPCPSCSKPVGLNWKVCPYCETTLIAPKRSSRSGSRRPKGEPSKSRGEGSDRSARSGKEPAGKPSRASRPSSKGGNDGEPTRRKSASSSGGDEPTRAPRSARRRIQVGDDEKSEPINRGEN
ncbi:MAG: zinc ribbon domain-containing protein [Solirubrobacterales bacterium]|nr:zinc ribbon domain-containing protein [Solirubrobacterales bacterium]